MMEKLTSRDYWDSKYLSGQEPQRLDTADFRQRPYKVLIEKLESLGLAGKKVLEIGAGGSAVLTCLAERNRGAGCEFHGLDYSEAGCEKLRALAAAAGVDVRVHKCDFLAPPAELLGAFGAVYSLGVVEHFGSLPETLRAQASLLAPGGLLFTLVPNLSGVAGALARRYNPEIFAMHKVYAPAELAAGHAAAGLETLSSGYLCSSNFGVLSACFSSPSSAGWTAHLWLSRLSKAAWYFENLFFSLPETRLFAPYAYVIARRPAP